MEIFKKLIRKVGSSSRVSSSKSNVVKERYAFLNATIQVYLLCMPLRKSFRDLAIAEILFLKPNWLWFTMHLLR